MHDYGALDSRVLVHVSAAFYGSVYSICSFAGACRFACIGAGVASQVVADGL